MKELKEQFAIKPKWNTLLGVVVQDTPCLAWQDNNIIPALSNLYIANQVEDSREKARKRFAKTLINGRLV